MIRWIPVGAFGLLALVAYGCGVDSETEVVDAETEDVDPATEEFRLALGSGTVIGAGGDSVRFEDGTCTVSVDVAECLYGSPVFKNIDGTDYYQVTMEFSCGKTIDAHFRAEADHVYSVSFEERSSSEDDCSLPAFEDIPPISVNMKPPKGTDPAEIGG